jgi:hypothetical protein
LIDEVLSEGNNSPTEFAKQLIFKAKTLSCASRSIHVTNNKLEKKVEKIKLASRSNTGLFAQALTIIRRKYKHRGIQTINPGSPEWFQIKDTTKLATDFCNEFQIDPKKGYHTYIDIGMGMMKNYSLTKFKTLHAAICNKFEALQEIERDRNPEETEKAHQEYLRIVADKTGFAQGYNNQPEKYKYFIQVKDESKRMGVSPRQYIQAQFAGFDWRSGIPDPSQLIGTKAIDRLQRWAFEKNVTLGAKERKINFKNIKNGN